MFVGGAKNWIFLVLCCWGGLIHAQPPSDTVQNHVLQKEQLFLQQLSTVMPDSDGVSLYDSLSGLFKNRDIRKYLLYAQRGFEYATEFGQEKDQLMFALKVGKGQILQGNCWEGLEFLEKSHEGRSYSEDSLHIEVLNTLGAAHLCLGNHQPSHDYYLESLALADSLGMFQAAIKPLTNLSVLYRERKDYAQALKYYRKGLRYAKQFQQPMETAFIAKDLAYVYLQMGAQDSAKVLLDLALELSEKQYAFPYVAADAHMNLSYLYLEKGNLGEAEAEALLGWEFSNEMGAPSYQIRALELLATVLDSTGKYAGAQAYAQKGLALAQQHQMKGETTHFYALLSDLYQKQGNFPQAFHFQQQQLQLQEEVFFSEREQYLTEAESRYQHLAKDKENATLRKQIQREQAAVNQSIWFGAIMFLLSLVSIGVVLIFRKEKATNILSPEVLLSNNQQYKLKFFKKLVVSVLFMMAPVIMYFIFIGNPGQVVLNIGISIWMLVSLRYMDQIPYRKLEWVNLLVSYTVILLSIYLLPQTPLIILVLFPGLLINTFLINQVRLQILNFMLAVVTIVFYYYLVKQQPFVEPTQESFNLDVILGGVVMYLVVLSLYFYSQYIKDFEGSLIYQNKMLKEAEVELRNSQELYQTLYTSMNDSVIVYNYINDYFVGANPAAYELLQLDPSRPLSSYSKYDVIPQKTEYTGEEDLHEAVDGHGREVLQGKKIKIPAGLFQRPDGSIILADVHVIPTFQHRGEAFVIARNVTQQVHNQQQLKTSEKKFRNIFDHSHQGILLFDTNLGKVKECNARTLDIFGYSDQASFLQADFSRLFDDEQLEGKSFTELIQELLEEVCSNSKAQCVILGRKQDQTPFTGELTAVMDTTQPYSILIFIHDVTERYQAQQEIAERKSIYEALIEYSFDGIDINELDMHPTRAGEFEGKLIVRNSRMKDWLAIREEDPMISTSKILEVSSVRQANGELTSTYLPKMVQQLKEKRHIQCDWQFSGKGGKTFDMELVSHLITIQGKILLIRILRDVTEHRLQQSIIDRQLFDLNQKKEQLEKYIDSNLQLENFAYIASHDLREPLITIKSFAQLLESRWENRIDEKEREFFRFIVSSSDNMLQLVEDLLKYSRVNTGEQKWECIDPAALIHKLALELNSLIIEKEARIELLNLPRKITADRIKLRQLFQNLIANALKFTRPGVPPVIRISCEKGEDRWVFSVQDNGIGIEPEFRERIFLLFKRLHNKAKYAGTGIGLALCKKIVEQHQGNIWVSSEVGQGSTFFFEISFHQNDTIPVPEQPALLYPAPQD